ncbi:MAG: response regulator [Lachnospiraceae bacterium]|nr:response regulator [Lachnospiraceae bacterium]
MYKVMIVDDEILVRIGLRSMIDWEGLGFQIVGEAGNGEAAYEKCLVLRPDVLITDIKMPQKDGFWLIEKVRELNPQIEVIVLTAYDEFEYVRKVMKLQVSDYILKAEMEEKEIEDILLAKKQNLDRRQQGNAENTEDNAEEKRQEQEEELLLGLLLNDYKPLELVKEKFEKMGIPWNQDSYCFLQLDFSSSMPKEYFAMEKTSGLLFACKQLISHRLQEKYRICLSKQFGMSITCFLLSKNISEKQLLSELQDIHEAIRQYFNISFQSASSRIETTLEEIRGQGAWIYRAADVLFSVEEGGHITQEKEENTARECERMTVYSEAEVLEITECLLNGDTKGWQEAVKEIKERCRRYLFSSMNLKLLMVQLANTLLKNCQTGETDHDERLLAYQKDMIEAVNLHVLFQDLSGYIECVQEILQESSLGNVELLLRKAETYVDKNYKNRIVVDDVASYLGISPYYFSNLFRKFRNIKFTSYLNQVRIEHAQKLLRDPRITVSQVYEETGFNDQSYFSKTFKKYTGMTVTEYKEKNIAARE